MTLEYLCQEVSRQMRPLAGQGVLIALSGGADSVALAWALCRLRQQEGWRLRAAHVNHGLRGEESDGDQAFVEALCRRLELPCACLRLSPPAQAGETWAREARYQALAAMARARGMARTPQPKRSATAPATGRPISMPQLLDRLNRAMAVGAS